MSKPTATSSEEFTVKSSAARTVLRATVLIIVGLVVRSLANIVLIRIGFQFLGAKTFGLWVLLQSLIMYLNLGDLGIGQGIMNAQAAAHERKDQAAMVRVVSSGAALFVIIAIIAWTLANGATMALPGLWKTEGLSHSELASYLLMLSGLSLAALPLSAFAASLGGVKDLEARYLWDISVSLVTATVTAVLFMTRQDLLLTLAVPLAVQLAWALIPVYLLRKRHRVSFDPGSISRSTMKALLKTSSFIFLMSVALLTQRFSANFIAGSLLNPEAVARIHPHFVLFQVFGWSLVDAGTRAMLPFITGLSVRGSIDKLRQITLVAGKLCCIVAAIFALMLLIFGRELMVTWLKSDVYLGTSVMFLLGLVFVFDSSSYVLTNVSIALEKHRLRSVLNLAYSLSGLGLGALGVWLSSAGSEGRVEIASLGLASGFAFNALVFHTFIFPFATRREHTIELKTMALKVWLIPCLYFLVFAGLTVAISQSEANGLFASIGLALVALIVAVFLTLRVLFDHHDKEWLRSQMGSRRWL